MESIEELFSNPSPFHWKMEEVYKLHGDVLAEHGIYRDSSDDGRIEDFPNKPEPEHDHVWRSQGNFFISTQI